MLPSRHLLRLLPAALPVVASGPAPTSLPSAEPAPVGAGAVTPNPATTPTGASSPSDAWTGLLTAMRAGDESAMARFVTSGGIASLEAGVRGEAKATVFRRWGEG